MTTSFPVTANQELAWSMARLGGSAALTRADLYRVHGRMELQALQAAVEELGRRHEVLRTSFSRIGRTLRQVVDPEPLRVEHHHVALGEPLEAVRLTEVRRGFDLGRGPMMRITLLETADPAQQLLLVAVHHIAFDAWSQTVFQKELPLLYAATTGERPLSEPPPLQYTDLAVRQQQWLLGDEYRRRIRFWEAELADARPVSLEVSRSHLDVGTEVQAGSIEFEFDDNARDGVSALCRRWRAARAAVHLAIFSQALTSVIGQSAFAIPVLTPGRSEPTSFGTIGFFLNQVLVRMDLSQAPTFDVLVGRAQQALLTSYRNEVPLPELIRSLPAVTRFLGDTRFVRVLFNVAGTPALATAGPETPRLELWRGGAGIRSDSGQGRPLRGDVEFVVRERTGTSALMILFDRTRIDEALLTVVGRRFVASLHEAVATPV